MSIQALNSSRALRFNAQQTTAKTMTMDELLALIQSGQISKSSQAAADPQIVVVTVPQAAANNSSPTNTSTTNQSSSPNLLMRAIDLSALLFFVALLGTFGTNLWNKGSKWFASESETGKNLWKTGFKDLPEAAMDKLNVVWSGLSKKYREGFEEKTELTPLHFREAILKMFHEADFEGVSALLGKIHKSLEGHVNNAAEFVSNLFSFGSPSEPNSEKSERNKIIILDNEDIQKLNKAGLGIETELLKLYKQNNSLDKPQELKDEITVKERAEFIVVLRSLLHTHNSEEFRSIDGFSEVSLRLLPFHEYTTQDSLETKLNVDEGGLQMSQWKELIKATNNLVRNLISGTQKATT